MRPARGLLVLIVAMLIPLAAGAFESASLEVGARDLWVELRRQFSSEATDPAGALAEGAAALGAGRWEEAAERYGRAVVAGPANPRAWRGLAIATMNVDAADPTAAHAAYRAFTTAASAPERAEALALLGSALERRARYREAIAAYRASVEAGADDGVRAHLAELVAARGFRATGVTVNADQERPEFCITFRGKLIGERRVRYEDYVRIEPPLAGGLAVRDDRLCASGAAHGARHTVTVLAGLPSADGDEAPGPETFDVEIGDRPASVGFKGNTYVLPRIGSAGIPVITVNVKRVNLKILRIDERNVIEQMTKDRLSGLLGRWDIEQIRTENGELVWQGEMDVASETNQRVTTAFPVGDLLKKTAPGIYAVIAEPAGVETPAWAPRATQWLVISDLGLTTFQGADGLAVFARSLATARPAAGVTVRLFARNNSLLAEAVTDAAGGARFAAGLLRGEGGRAPKALFAFGAGGDFNLLELTAPPFDLSDRGVGGREPPGPVDVFLYGDRGVYRPGETAHVVALMRDDTAHAVETMPLTVRLLRPDGVEARRDTVKPQAIGAYALDLPFSQGALTGRWTVEVHIDPAAPPVGTLRLLVEDVVPPRIEVKLSTAATLLRPGEVAGLALTAGYLYGAPAADLPVEGEVVVMADDNPFPDRPGYHFGLADETVDPQRIPLPAMRTDAAGAAAMRVALDKVSDTTRPLKAVIRAGVFEMGGRSATASLTLPVRQRAVSVGLHPRFGANGVAEGSEAVFDLIMLDAAGKAIAGSLDYALYREEWTYQWFRRNGVWDYEVQVVDKRLVGGTRAVTAETPLELAQPVEAGRYRLEVSDPQSGAASSLRFHAGWFVSASVADRPDTLELVADHASYRPGETVKLHIAPPFDGDVLLAIANERLIETYNVYVPATGATVEIPFRESWGVGAYVLATAFREDSGARGPGRAIGLAWLGLDARPRTLNLSIDSPGDVRPSGPVEINVAVDGLEAGKPAFVTLAAVDEGVLQLTGFDTPDPANHFYGKRRLGVAMRDIYGRLIDGKIAKRGAVRSGGGDPRLANRGAPPADVRIVSLFSGLVRLDDKGGARIRLDLPDFNGRLRLMAVAFDADRVGAAEGVLMVRDPLVAQVSLPRFLAPGDDSRMTLRLDNLRLPAGEVSVALRAEGAVALAGETKMQKALDKGASASAVFALKGLAPGTGTIVMEVAGPEGFKLERRLTVGVRPAQFPITRRLAKRLRPGERATYAPSVLEGLVPGTGELLLSFSPRPDLDAAGLLRALDRYPYGCLEQTTSRALPLLYVADVAAVWGGMGMTAGQKGRIDEAVSRLFEMQRADGGFGVWAPSDGADLWLSAYALDFATRAKARGHRVPAHAYAAGLKWMGEKVRQGERQKAPDLAGLAYAHYVLAAAGIGNPAEARYFADRVGDRLPTAMAAAQVAAALALRGEAERARLLFAKAAHKVNARPAARDYGSALRDLAGLVVLAAETEPLLKGNSRDLGGRSLAQLVEDLAARQTKAEALSSQEQAWLLMAAAATSQGNGKMTLTVDGWKGEAQAEPLYLKPTDAQMALGLTYENAGRGTVWHTATVTGVPVAETPAVAEGFTLTRGFYTLDGRPADLRAVRQNDTLIAVIEGEAPAEIDHQALIVDLLPAGFEIENARLADARSTAEMAWLPKLSPAQHLEYRDDRFVAALDIGAKSRAFAVAYLVRAVTPGSYRLPAAHVEDMYKPQYRARTAMGWLTILPRN